MKRVIVALVSVALAGCGAEILTTTAIRGELEAQQAGAIGRQLEHISDSAAKTNIQRGINTYYAEKGYYPKSLNELVPGYLPSLPTRSDGTPYNYDPVSGKLVDGPVAAPAAGVQPMATDAQRMGAIRAAIQRYGQTTGYYPVSLQVLVPYYISAVPKTVDGRDFVYYPQNGTVYHPSQLTQQAGAQQTWPQKQTYTPQRPNAGRTASGVGVGGGPMAEMMTGIAMQNELNKMSSSASSTAGAHMRSGIDKATQQHNLQQQQALDDLAR